MADRALSVTLRQAGPIPLDVSLTCSAGDVLAIGASNTLCRNEIGEWEASNTDYEAILEIGKAVGVKYNGPSALGEAALPFLEAQATKRFGVVFEFDHIASWDHTKLAGNY